MEINTVYISLKDYHFNRTDWLRDGITEEIADCYVMLEQFKLYYGISDEEIKNLMDYKIDRQIKRIEDVSNS